MSLSVMFGLAEPDLPEGRPYIHNCPDDDAPFRKPKSTGKSSGGMRYCMFSRAQAIKRYGDAFAKLGGTATKSELTKVITDFPPTTIYQYLIRHQGDTTRIVGKRNREYVWEWIHGNE